MRAVIIKDGVVINATNTDSLIHPDGLKMVYSKTAAPGWLYDGKDFTALEQEIKIDPIAEAKKELEQAKTEAEGKALTMVYLDKRLTALEKIMGV